MDPCYKSSFPFELRDFRIQPFCSRYGRFWFFPPQICGNFCWIITSFALVRCTWIIIKLRWNIDEFWSVFKKRSQRHENLLTGHPCAQVIYCFVAQRLISLVSLLIYIDWLSLKFSKSLRILINGRLSLSILAYLWTPCDEEFLNLPNEEEIWLLLK